MFSSSMLHAQYYFSNDRYYESPVLYEVGVKAGVMNALTDLGGKMVLGRASSKTCAGILPGPVTALALWLRITMPFQEGSKVPVVQ